MKTDKQIDALIAELMSEAEKDPIHADRNFEAVWVLEMAKWAKEWVVRDSAREAVTKTRKDALLWILSE